MGHRVSVPCHGFVGGTAVAASMAVLLAAASASDASFAISNRPTPSSRRGCFAPDRRFLPAARASASALSSTCAYLSASAAAATSVPPPNSRLGRMRRRRLQSPGTKGGQRGGRAGGGRLSDLKYATHGAHYSRYCGNGDVLADSSDDDRHGKQWRDFVPRASDSTGEETDARGESGGKMAIASEPLPSTNRRRRARMRRCVSSRLLRRNRPPNREGFSSSNCTRLMYEQRKAAWAAKYTSVSTLRKSFGSNKNRIWGDFDPPATRRLYHTLLPRALLELRGLRDGLLRSGAASEDDGESADGEEGSWKRWRRWRADDVDQEEGDGPSEVEDAYLQDELKELAPLAYQARLAAKKYARERSRLPGRIGSMLFDGYRSWRRYGRWTTAGMTWEQVWTKYEDQVLREVTDELEDAPAADGGTNGDSASGLHNSSAAGNLKKDLDDDELTARICLRILERSVATNEAVDRLFLRRLEAEDDDDGDEARSTCDEDGDLEEPKRRRRRQQMQADLLAIERKFDNDVRELLRYGNLTTREGDERRQRTWQKRKGFFWAKQEFSFENERASSKARGDDLTASYSDPLTLARDSSAAGAPDLAEDLAAAMFAVVSSTAAEGSGPVAAEASNQDGDRGLESPTLRKLDVHEVFALRILATTKRRISSLQALPQLRGRISSERDKDET